MTELYFDLVDETYLPTCGHYSCKEDPITGEMVWYCPLTDGLCIGEGNCLKYTG